MKLLSHVVENPFPRRRMKVPKTVSLDSLTDKQACRVARVPVKDKLSEFERPLDAAAFSCRARVPERAVVVPPSGCFLPNCSFTGSSLKEYSNHFRSTTHDLEALIEPLDKRVLDAITSWPLRIKEWKIASIEEGDIMGTDFFFAPAAFVYVLLGGYLHSHAVPRKRKRPN